MPTKLTNEVITAAIEGFEAQKVRIDAQISELRGLLNGSPAETEATPGVAAPKRKRILRGGSKADEGSSTASVGQGQKRF
jgi:hypothetical protein